MADIRGQEAARKCRPSLVLGIILLCQAVVGCGGPGEIAGKVSYRNRPVPSGWVTACSADGKTARGEIAADGAYHIGGVPVGEVKLTVCCPDPGNKGITDPANRRSGKVLQPSRVHAAPVAAPSSTPGWFPIPGRYGDLEQTPLGLTVTSGSNVFDINLE